MNSYASRLLNEIRSRTEWSEICIAKKLRVSQPTVNRILKNQVDCKGTTFLAISELHASVFSDCDKCNSAVEN